MLLRVSLRIQSRSLSNSDITELIGASPSWAVERGSPVSSRRPEGPRHEGNTWLRDSTIPTSDFSEHLLVLEPFLNALHAVRIADPDIKADVLLMLEAAPLGSMVNLGYDQILVLADARCGLVIDAYESDDEAV